MKKLCFSFILFLLATGVAFGANEWDEDAVKGTDNASDLDTNISNNLQEPLTRILRNHRQDAYLHTKTTSTFSVSGGEVVCDNSGNTAIKMRRNTSDTAVTWSDLDTGAEAADTYYYAYANCDADATTYTITISASASAPTGVTSFALLGYYYNDSSSDIQDISSVGQGSPNIIQVVGTSDITTTSTSYTDMTDMEIRFYSTGRPVRIDFTAPINSESNSDANNFTIDIDGTDKVETEVFAHNIANRPVQVAIHYVEALSSGTHTIKLQWKVASGSVTLSQEGATEGDRILTAEEI